MHKERRFKIIGQYNFQNWTVGMKLGSRFFLEAIRSMTKWTNIVNQSLNLDWFHMHFV